MKLNIFEAGRRARLVSMVVIWGWAVIYAIFLAEGDRLTTMSIGAVFAGIVYGASWAAGWIVRGLLGIPSGSDFRPE